MPRLADHAERRRQITDAVRRVIAREGLAAATFQTVAAEAGISVRLVQYYFGTKRDFLLATHRAVAEDAGARFQVRVAGLGADAAPRDVVRAVLAELLPTDAARRADAVVLDAFHSASLTGAEVEAEDTRGATRFLVGLVVEQRRRARVASGEPSAEAAGEEDDAWLVVLAAAGLAQAMLVDDVVAARWEVLLDRLVGGFTR